MIAGTSAIDNVFRRSEEAELTTAYPWNFIFAQLFLEKL
jgi:hypothetical protein